MNWLVRMIRRLGQRPAPPPRGQADPVARGESIQERLRRLANQCVTGNPVGAELELRQWARATDCPPNARTLLASLLVRRGENDEALALLRAAPTDLGAGRLRTALLAQAQLPEAARQAALAVHLEHGHDPAVEQWLHALEVCPAYPRQPFNTEALRRLEAELLARPLVIPSLVAAAHIKPDLVSIQALRAALSSLAQLPDDDDLVPTLCQALAELALLADDPDDARRWAHRGLKINPYSASLALVLAQVSDDVAVGPPAVDVLRRAAAAHPNYPDLRLALERREQAA